MSRPNTWHPTPAQLTAFGLGRLSATEWPEVNDHLARCAACRGQVDAAPNDRFLALVRRSAGQVGSSFPAPRRSGADPSAPGPALAPADPAVVTSSGVTVALARKPEWPLLPGYEIVQELGEGGMGKVYLARQVELRRFVALKMIRSGAEASAEEMARFRAEARAVARLQHANIVQIYEIDEQAGQPYFSMEFVEGRSLEKKLAGIPQPPRAAADLLAVLARGVHAAHQCGILHRDLKPANVLLTRDGQPKITDFGLAKRLDAREGQTQQGMVLGTPSYMAPEQARGDSARIGPATDVYALGATLYEMLTGRPPFKGETAWDTVLQVISVPPVPPTQLQPKVPRDLETICLKCLEKEPERRYATAEALAEDLRRWLAGEPIHARPSTVWERAVKWARRRPALAGLLLVSCLAVLGLLLGGWLHSTRLQGAFDEQSRLRQLAEERERTIRGYRYAYHTTQAYRAWDQGQVGHALDLLAGAAALERAGSVSDGMGPVANASGSFQADEADLRGWEWFHLDRACHADLQTLRGHAGPVRSVAFSPDGDRLASGGTDRTVRVWEAGTGKVLHKFTGHTAPITGVVFNPDGRQLASASADTTVRVWDLAADKEVGTLGGHILAVTAVAFSPDGKRLASASADTTVKVWDVDAGKELFTFQGHTRRVAAVAFHPDGRLASAGEDGTVRVWDATGKDAKDAPGLRVLLSYLERIPAHLDAHALIWFLAAGLYALVALSRRSFFWILAAAGAANFGLWALLGHAGIAFLVHPQVWLIPLALIVLTSEHVNRDLMRPELAGSLRYLGLCMIYVASTADLYIAGVGNSVWLPVVLALLSVVGVLAGILLRVKAFLFLGVSFLLVDVLTMIWYAAVDQAHTWVWWAAGVVLGLAILALFAVFEKRRNDVLRLIDEIRR